jgi:glutamate carboxypeptidase
MPLSEVEKSLLEALRAAAPRWEERLAELVNVSSFSTDVEGVDRVVDRLEPWLTELGFETETRRSPGGARHLIGRRAGRGPRVLLVGHSDTVFPADHAVGGFRVDPEDASRILGPGVTDMKGGNIVMLSALEILAAAGALEFIEATVFFCADEEIGSPTGRAHLEELSGRADLALVFETGSERPAGVTTFVTERAGMGRARIEIEGLEAHAGAKKDRGISAALVAARLVEALESHNDFEAGSTVNVGVLRAGDAANTVPGRAELLVDFRYRSARAGDELEAQIRRLVKETVIVNPLVEAHSRGQVIMEMRNDPMLPDARVEKLVQRLQSVATRLGLRLEPERRGGASDGNLTSAMACPTLDGLGTVGGRIHSAGEWMRRSSLHDRAALLSLFLLDLGRRGEGLQ